jgi:hypothetical protein
MTNQCRVGVCEVKMRVGAHRRKGTLGPNDNYGPYSLERKVEEERSLVQSVRALDDDDPIERLIIRDTLNAPRDVGKIPVCGDRRWLNTISYHMGNVADLRQHCQNRTTVQAPFAAEAFVVMSDVEAMHTLARQGARTYK